MKYNCNENNAALLNIVCVRSAGTPPSFKTEKGTSKTKLYFYLCCKSFGSV